MMPSHSEFLSAIQSRNLGLSERQAEVAARFAVILHRENEQQNLTRILGVEAFVDGHLLDAVELLKQPDLGQRVLDIGSGSGVPGLLAASLDQESQRIWFLTDSEAKKAEYLDRARLELGLRRVSVFPKRAELVLDLSQADTAIARAVGSVEKISGWIWNCSTWNNLILFKSRGWEEEWKEARLSKFGKKLTVTHSHDYSDHSKTRLLITLKRK
jgi:16S rRNA (guanine527-N7)-methyltransferase